MLLTMTTKFTRFILLTIINCALIKQGKIPAISSSFSIISKGHNDPNPPKKYFCSGTRLGVSFWVNKSRDIVFFEKFDLKSVWAKA